jgi:hypothetical protein
MQGRKKGNFITRQLRAAAAAVHIPPPLLYPDPTPALSQKRNISPSLSLKPFHHLVLSFLLHLLLFFFSPFSFFLILDIFG